MSIGGVNFRRWWGKAQSQLMDVDGKTTTLKEVLESIQADLDQLAPDNVRDVIYVGDPTKAGSWKIQVDGTRPNTQLNTYRKTTDGPTDQNWGYQSPNFTSCRSDSYA